MRGRLERLLARYGQTALAENQEGQREIRAFLQPVMAPAERVPSGMTALGHTDGRLWRYLGVAALTEGDTLAWKGLRLRVRSCRGFYTGETLSHYEAVLEQAKERTSCGS